MASSPITSRQIDGETMETVTDFIFLGSKITADGDCSHEIKRRLVCASSILAFRMMCSVSSSVISNSLQLHGLQPASFLCPWDSHDKNTGVGFHALLQEIFLPQGWNLRLPHCRQILYCLSSSGISWESSKSFSGHLLIVQLAQFL